MSMDYVEVCVTEGLYRASGEALDARKEYLSGTFNLLGGAVISHQSMTLDITDDGVRILDCPMDGMPSREQKAMLSRYDPYRNGQKMVLGLEKN